MDSIEQSSPTKPEANTQELRVFFYYIFHYLAKLALLKLASWHSLCK
jgi:hypothetical protein